ncbi:MAG: hypothetical protein OXI87_02880 [Albidovulum sp.]|nr:hypothetical protein [Albidovulum sp.]MDE0532745.1 hypothetical protein [Albidovulum sp.]
MKEPEAAPAILMDSESRSAFNRESGSQCPLGQINVTKGGGALVDLKGRSRVAAINGYFKLGRACFNPDCSNARMTIEDVVEREAGK